MSTDNQSAQSEREAFETWYAANRQTLGATTSIAAMTVWYAALASGSKLTCFYAEEIGLPPHACLDCCYDPDEIRARSALAQAPAPSEEDADLHRHIHRIESGRYDRSDLVRALAVILAEIERLDRAAAPKGASK